MAHPPTLRRYLHSQKGDHLAHCYGGQHVEFPRPLKELGGWRSSLNGFLEFAVVIASWCELQCKLLKRHSRSGALCKRAKRAVSSVQGAKIARGHRPLTAAPACRGPASDALYPTHAPTDAHRAGARRRWRQELQRAARPTRRWRTRRQCAGLGRHPPADPNCCRGPASDALYPTHAPTDAHRAGARRRWRHVLQRAARPTRRWRTRRHCAGLGRRPPADPNCCRCPASDALIPTHAPTDAHRAGARRRWRQVLQRAVRPTHR